MKNEKNKLTPLEQFAWDNQDRSASALATETNRDEGALAAAYNRAHAKMRNRVTDEINAAILKNAMGR